MPKEILEEEKETKDETLNNTKEVSETYFSNMESNISNSIEQARLCFCGAGKDKDEEKNKEWKFFLQFIEEQFENGVSVKEINTERIKKFPEDNECWKILFPALLVKCVQMPHELETYTVKKEPDDK